MTEPYSRLFLVAPAGKHPDHLAACLESALSCGDIASLRLPCEPETISKLMPIAQAADVAVLIDGDARLSTEQGADGVEVIGDLSAYEAARAIVGPDRIVGVDTGSMRHAAMETAEAGADYVVINQSAAMDDGETVITWWAEVMQVPCVTQHPCDPGAIAGLAAAGVDFVRPLDAMWDSPETARKVIDEALAAVAGAAS